MRDGAVCVEADDVAGLGEDGLGNRTLWVLVASNVIAGDTRDGGLVEAVNRPARALPLCGPLAAVNQTWVHVFQEALA